MVVYGKLLFKLVSAFLIYGGALKMEELSLFHNIHRKGKSSPTAMALTLQEKEH